METATLASTLGQQRPSLKDGREVRVLAVPDPVIIHTHSCRGQQGRGTGLCSCLAAKVSITGILMAPKTASSPVFAAWTSSSSDGQQEGQAGPLLWTDEGSLALPAVCACAFLWGPLVEKSNQAKVCFTAQQGLRAH